MTIRGTDIRRALPADLPAVAAIYGREAREGHATFDLEPRPMQVWEARLGEHGDQFLVADDGGTIAGYATSSPYRPKPAYVHTRETTVYVAPGQQGVQGAPYGVRLLGDLARHLGLRHDRALLPTPEGGPLDIETRPR